MNPNIIIDKRLFDPEDNITNEIFTNIYSAALRHYKIESTGRALTSSTGTSIFQASVVDFYPLPDGHCKNEIFFEGYQHKDNTGWVVGCLCIEHGELLFLYVCNKEKFSQHIQVYKQSKIALPLSRDIVTDHGTLLVHIKNIFKKDSAAIMKTPIFVKDRFHAFLLDKELFLNYRIKKSKTTQIDILSIVEITRKSITKQHQIQLYKKSNIFTIFINRHPVIIFTGD